ncbi:MAG: GTP cyclohydrolase II, partial [Pseudomonadota bacterium]|nr:GTP cyclohydrolase II [Pseudomonadota bacterium]
SDATVYWANPPLDIVPLAKAPLPIKGAEQATLTCFRTRWGTSTHLALIVGNPAADASLVRIHSSCVTGDILGSLRCDCGSQLQLALEQITQAGSGIFIYLHQEGRGIGIANKLRAYALQEKGLDTYEANLMLGFDEDERDFALAAGILKKLGVKKIRLMTNNPGKLKALEKAGITIAERVPLVAESGRHNHSYLEAKAKKSGHLF